MTEATLNRILVSAYACGPGEGSEPGVGWHALLAALESSERVTVVTRQNNIPAIRRALDADQLKRLLLAPTDGGRLALSLKRLLPGGVQMYYAYWQVLAARKMRELHAEHRYQVGHHATFAVDWLPSGIMSVPDLPIVWGPVGGASYVPFPLWRYLGWRGVIAEVIRICGTGAARAIFGDINSRRASLTIAQNDDTAMRYRKRGAQVIVQPNTAIEIPAGESVATTGGEPVLLGAGRLLPWKGWSIAIHALAHLNHPELQLRIYGAGPDRRRLLRLAKRLGVDDKLDIRPPIERTKLMAEIRGASVFVFPSLRESAGWALAEAITLGVPVVGLPLGGVKTLITRSELEPVRCSDEALHEAFAAAIETARTATETLASDAWLAPRFREMLRTQFFRVAEAQHETTRKNN